MRKIKNKNGMTLIEVIIAMAIFSIFVIIIITVYTSVIKVVGDVRQRVVENYEIQAELESEYYGDASAVVDLTSHTIQIIYEGLPPVDVEGFIAEHSNFTGQNRYKIFIPGN